MKRLLALVTVCILLLGTLCVPASADSMASKVDLLCTVNSEGDCLVSMNVMLQLSEARNDLAFPLPLTARDITLNNSSAATRKTASATLVDIGRYTDDFVGEIQLIFSYTLPEAVKVNPDAGLINGQRKLQLTLPMLCGFELPVSKLTFIVNMPSADMSNPPDFTSTYRQSSLGSDLTVDINGSQIIGASKVQLNDHDGVTMTMLVPQEMFPTVSTYVREGNPEIVPMAVFAILALIYWILFLRSLPLIRSRTSTPPEGITAGELGCRLTHAGGDLTMMVFTWARLGYILIHMDGNGRIMLHKRMDMGNERSQFENKIFKLLFGSRRVVDGTGYPYALLCRKVAGIVPSERNMNRRNSGNAKIFRGLACVSQIFCGICVAMNMSTVPVLYVLMSIILGIFGAVSGWMIQGIAYRTHLRGKVPVYMGFACILIWILLGILCGQIWIPLCCCLGQFLIGYLAAYGGRRSELGRHDAAQVLGLRSYVKRISGEDINRLLKNDPDYFFNMAPYALALGVINPFAKSFARRKIDQCPYLITRVHGKRSAEDWGHLMADVADMMDAKSRRMMWESLLPQGDALEGFFRKLQSGGKKKAAPKTAKPGRKPAPKKRTAKREE